MLLIINCFTATLYIHQKLTLVSSVLSPDRECSPRMDSVNPFAAGDGQDDGDGDDDDVDDDDDDDDDNDDDDA